MVYGKIINNTKYMYVRNENQFKFQSLNDNVYFTLRDIFFNAIEFRDVTRANEFNRILTNHIFFEDRNANFSYSNCLQDKEYLIKLINWLNYFKLNFFDFEQVEEQINEELDFNELLELDIWWKQFENLKRLLRENYNQLM